MARFESLIEAVGNTPLVGLPRLSIPGWDALASIRDEIGLRGPLHSAEKLVDHLGASRFVVGHTHSSYRERLQGALSLLGATLVPTGW